MAVVAHDLRNPLSTVRLSTVVLRRAAGSSEDRERNLAKVERAVAHMDRLIGDLVGMAQIDQGRLGVVLRPEPVDSIVREAVEAFALRAQERGVDLQMGLPPPSGVLLGDRERLVQVLGNLLDNALRVTSRGDTIWLRASDRAAEVVFEVEDSGPGIPPENVPHVFERHWKTPGGGSGLGLFIAQSIVTAHGGRLEVRTQPGHGATFFFAVRRVLERSEGAA
jgi:signal transduction histidine kinase